MSTATREAGQTRLGLIGSGYQGRYLSEAAATTGAYELVACADPNAEAAGTAVRVCGYRTPYLDYADMLSQEPLDAVIVATTHDQLQPAALAAVQAGKHVFVEKPMALTAGDGRKLVAAARQAGVRLMVGYTLRFMPPRRLMKRLLDEGVIGEVRQIIAGQCLGNLGGWLEDPARGGGPLLYVGTHVLDQVLWVAGQPAERVSAEINWKSEGGVEAEAMWTIRFPSGALAQVCTCQTMGGRYGWLDILGTAGRLRTEWESHCVWIESQVVDAYRHFTQIEVPADAYIPGPVAGACASLASHRYVRAWGAELAEFAAAIREGRDTLVTGEDGVRVLEVTDAVFESGSTGEAVAVERQP
jgi:predicted dehydrogenase